MIVLVYRYGSICEPDIIDSLKKLNINVIEICEELTDKKMSSSRRVEIVSENIQKHHPVFIFSINFFPAIAEVCHIFKIPYLCWTVDSPVLELFSKSIQYDTNRIFLFDRAQYNYFHRFNPDCIFHMPLAAATDRYDEVISSSMNDSTFGSYDISFIGSLYIERNPLHDISLTDYISGYIDGIVDASLKIYGYNFIEDVLTDECIEYIKSHSSGYYKAADSIVNPDSYIVANSYIGMQAAETERIRTLNTLAEYFNVELFTRSDTAPLKNVHLHGGVRTHTEMPVIFNRSKINLNMTIKPIKTGLPLRIFDIMGCGGFLMTNYQEEAEELFEIGVDLETYGSMEELVDKCSYYLSHEDERSRIALNGYNKVKESHNYQNKLIQILQKASEK